MHIGLFGGSFDPPHLGHLILAAEAVEQLHLDRLLWLLAAEPPHKQTQSITTIQNRIDMVMAAIENNPHFELSRIDIDRHGPHYTIETLSILKEIYPDSCLSLIIGGDSLRNLPGWYKPQEIVSYCDSIGVMLRPQYQINLDSLEIQLPGIQNKIRWIEAPLLEISSNQIRKRVSTASTFRYYVPWKVFELIQKYNLYR